MSYGTRISGIAYYLPEGRITAEEAAEVTGFSADRRREKLGIDSVAVADPSQCTSDLAVHAINQLLLDTRMDPESIDFLILVTQSPDRPLPATACIVQDKARLPRHLLAYDVNQGCSGFVIGLAQAKGLIASGICRRGLLVTSEMYNRLIAPGDRDTFGLFGDAATAVCVERSDDPNAGIGDFFFGVDGSGADKLTWLPAPENRLYMNGRGIFEFVVRTLPPEINAFLKRQSLAVKDIDHFIFHQANRYMNERLVSELGISPERAFFDITEMGNTVSNTIPIALKKAQEARAMHGRKILMVGFGVGLSWAGALYTLREDGTL